MSGSGVVFRVVDWDRRYETARSLKSSGALAEVPLSTDLGASVMRRLLALPGSAALLGVWYFLQALAAQSGRRGTLTAFGNPLTTGDLARLSGWSESLLEQALQVLCSPEIGLLEQVSLDEALRPPALPEPVPRKPRKPKPLQFSHCPVCNADLVAIAAEQSLPHAHHHHDCPDCSPAHVASAASVPAPNRSHTHEAPRPTGRDVMGEPDAIRSQFHNLQNHQSLPVAVERSRPSQKSVPESSATATRAADGESRVNRPPPTPAVRTDNRLKSKRKHRALV